MLRYQPLPREEVTRVLEGRGNAARVPAMIHFWVYPDEFGERKQTVEEILSRYPQDALIIPARYPDLYDAPGEDASYRWSW